jgi:hypothetical protein
MPVFGEVEGTTAVPSTVFYHSDVMEVPVCFDFDADDIQSR